MPVARTNVEREEKVREILGAAQRRLLTGGYESMSVAAIARELQIAQNSVYWYFPSKDDLFVAAFRDILARINEKKPPPGSPVARVVWVTDNMAHLASLRAALRSRAAHSDAAADLLADLDKWTRALLLSDIEARLPPAGAEVASQALLATIEGALSRNLPAEQRRQVIAFAYQRIAGPPPGGPARARDR